MKLSKTARNALTLLALALFSGGLWAFRDSLPLSALSSAAAESAAIQGLVGKATRVQQAVEKSLAELEDRSDADEAAVTELEEKLAGARKDLKLAFNMMNAYGAPTDVQGFYYARTSQQSELERRVAEQRAKVGGEAATTADADQ